MNLHIRPRARLVITVMFAVALVSTMSAGYAVSVAQESLLESCADHERAQHNDQATGALCNEGAGWPDFDPTDMTREIAQHEAQQEAATWPDFDPSDMTREVAQYEAQQEAASWPDFNPSDMTREIARYEAKQEAAMWPDFDPSDMTAEVAATAKEASEGAAAHGNPFVL